MAGSSDVRAGRAFVELFTKDSALISGLRKAMASVRGFAKESRDVAVRTALAGFGIVGGFVAAAKTFASTGVELAKLQSQTGMSAKALSGLSQSAADNELEFEPLAKSITFLQKSIAGGSKETAEAFLKIGLSVDQVKKMRLEDVIGTIADRLPKLKDEEQRVEIATKLFGKAGQNLLPVLADGSGALNEAAEAAHRLGTAFDDEGLAKAQHLDDAFDSLTASLKGLRNAVGEAVADAVLPLVNGLVDVLVLTRMWIKENPQAVESIFNVALATGVLALAVAAVATAVLAATSPVVLLTGLIVGMAGSLLAVTDTLGITRTGFGDLFNSIRVGGQGLATWFTKFAIFLGRTWFGVEDFLGESSDFIKTGFRNLGSAIYEALIWVPRALIEPFAELGQMINDLLGTDINVRGALFIDRMDEAQRESREAIEKRDADFDKRSQRRTEDAAYRDEFYNHMLAQLDAADPNDGSTGVDFDPKKFLSGLEKMGEGVAGAARDAIDAIIKGLKDRIAGRDMERASSVDPFNASNKVARETVDRANKVDVMTTFNADFANRLGVGTTLEERKLRAAELTARNTGRIINVLEDNGSNGAAFGP